ncbi:type I polyketide synthase, partial [Croceitalea marina]
MKYSKKTGLEIAVIGMSGRFPGAKNVSEYWENLKGGKEGIYKFSEEELLKNDIPLDLLNDPNYVRAKGFIEDIEYFDNELFGYTPAEAMTMDPQLRIFQECTWQALEDAGYITNLDRYLVGVYAGATMNFSWLRRLEKFDAKLNPFQLLSLNFREYLTTQLSYRLNLKGPSVSILTACSTSLVAVNRACKDLLTGDCNMAIAGGVSIDLPHKSGYLYQEGMISSSDGHCRAFDHNANGTVTGDGVGVVILKRYDEAVRDGDHVYAVIKGTGINNDGNDKIGFTAPSYNGQAKVIKDAIYMSEIEADRITYIEAHGTGTSLGDPIEIKALKQAFNTDKNRYCAIGSVKTNIGHLNTAAGIAGFIKTVLALKHKQIPASLHFEKPNPKIDFENSPFYVNTELRDWEANGHSRVAGVSSFGIGGTNAHVILEEAPEPAQTSKGRTKQLLVLSAKHESSLLRNKENLVRSLQDTEETNFADIAYTLQVGRKALEHKLAVVCENKEQAIEALNKSNGVYTGYSETGNKELVFMFPGQGAQYATMGYGLYKREKVFRQEVDKCLDILRREMGEEVKAHLFPDETEGAGNSDTINETKYTQPLLFAIEYALARQLMAWGIEPDVMIGHSLGEYVAACISGVFNLTDALTLVCKRSALMDQLETGSMLSVALPEDKVKERLGGELSIAAINSPNNCVVSGPHEPVKKLEKALQQEGVFVKILKTSHAFHSAMMEPMLAEFKEAVKSIAINSPEIPYISNVTGKYITAEQVQD